MSFNLVYKQAMAMYVSDCQISGNWSKLKPGFKEPAHRTAMLQINIILHLDTLNRNWVNQRFS